MTRQTEAVQDISMHASRPDARRLPPPGPAWLLWLLWGVVLVSPAFVTVLIIFFLDVETDFQELYEIGRRVLQTGRLTAVYTETPAGEIYPEGALPEALGITPERRLPIGFYPPSALPLFMLWSSMPAMAACFLSCAAYGLLFFLAIRLLPGEAMRVHPRQRWHAWLFLSLIVGPYITYDIVTGQVSGVPMFALVVGYVCWRRGQVWRGAAALAFGIAFKLLPGVAVLFFAVKRQWKMVAATGLLSLAFGLLPGLVLFGPGEVVEGWRAYSARVARPKSDPVSYEGRIRWTKPASFLNPSLSVTLLRWLTDYPRDHHTPFLPVATWPQPAVLWSYRGLMLAMGAVTLWMCRRRAGAGDARSSGEGYRGGGHPAGLHESQGGSPAGDVVPGSGAVELSPKGASDENAGWKPAPHGHTGETPAPHGYTGGMSAPHGRAGERSMAHCGGEPAEALAVQYGLVLLWMVLLSPHLAVYYMAWALWPVAVMMGFVARRDLLEHRPDRANAWALWIFALSFYLSTISTLRAAGMHPAVLLLLWAVMAWNATRGKWWRVG